MAQEALPVSLLQLLSNSLILYHTAPYLPTSSLLSLGATSKSFRSLIHETPGVFRYLDLTRVKSAQFEIAGIDHGGQVWRNQRMDESVTEDDFYGGPLQFIFNKLRKHDILRDVQTMILDGLSVTSDLVSEIILHESFNVRILSIREVQNLNERKVQQALLYAVRPSRPENTPKIQALYIFGARDSAPPSKFRRYNSDSTTIVIPDGSAGGVVHSQGAQIGAEWNQRSGNSLADIMERGDKWYQGSGKVFGNPPSLEWATTIQACEGIISFDTVLCKGPRHTMATEDDSDKRAIWYQRKSAALPTQSVTCAVGACDGCGASPEGFARFGQSPVERSPLLAPPPLHSSLAKTARTPFGGFPERAFIARCADCLRNRYCESCHKWWCEDCYEVPNHSFYGGPWEAVTTKDGASSKKIKPGVLRSCFECGSNCVDCVRQTELICRVCGGGYCAIHNEGSTLTTAGRHAINGCRC